MWETTKCAIRGFCISFSSTLAKMKIHQFTQLEDKIQSLQNLQKQHFTEQQATQLSSLKDELYLEIWDLVGTLIVKNPGHELLFTHHQRSLLHHIDFHTTQTVTYHPKTTFPIIHCTDDAHTTDCTDHTQLIPICTLFISLGLSLCDRRVLYAHIATLADSYLTEPFVVVIIVLPC